MGVRETLGKHRAVALGASIVVIAACGFWTFTTLTNNGQMTQPTKAYYTADDGQTTFTDDITRVCPFDYNGKEAVRARVYTCDDGKTTFVGYLEKYTPEYCKKAAEDRAKAQKLVEEGKTPPPAIVGTAEVFARLVKRPGDKDWSPAASANGVKVTTLACPDGKGILDSRYP